MCGNWTSEHFPDGSLRTTVKSTKGFFERDAVREGGSMKKVFKFDLAKLADNRVDAQQGFIALADLSRGALPNEGAIYAALEIEEL